MIAINERFRIEPYTHGWQVVQTVATTKKDGTAGTKEESYHYPTLRHCLRFIVDQDAKQAESLSEIIERLDQISAEIDAALQHEPA